MLHAILMMANQKPLSRFAPSVLVPRESNRVMYTIIITVFTLQAGKEDLFTQCIANLGRMCYCSNVT